VADTLTPILGLTKPNFEGPADIRTISTDMDIIDAAFGNVASLPAAINLLTNAGFEVWQRGPGAWSTSGAWTADRWQMILGSGSTLALSQNAVTVDLDVGSQYTLSGTYNAAGAASRIEQPIENYHAARGRSVTFTIRVKANAPAAVRPFVRDTVVGYFYGADHTGSNAFETLRVTAAVGQATASLVVGVELHGTALVQLDNAVLVLGAVAPPFAALHPAEQLDRCLRYYQEIGDPAVAGSFIGSGFVISATGAQCIVRYATEMAVVPTITISAPTDFEVGNAAGASVPCTSLILSTPALDTRRECRLIATVAGGLVAGNATFLRGSNANARIRLEANPS
jgi:hypothetical protein